MAFTSTNLQRLQQTPSRIEQILTNYRNSLDRASRNNSVTIGASPEAVAAVTQSLNREIARVQQLILQDITGERSSLPSLKLGVENDIQETVLGYPRTSDSITLLLRESQEQAAWSRLERVLNSAGKSPEALARRLQEATAAALASGDTPAIAAVLKNLPSYLLTRETNPGTNATIYHGKPLPQLIRDQIATTRGGDTAEALEVEATLPKGYAAVSATAESALSAVSKNYGDVFLNEWDGTSRQIAIVPGSIVTSAQRTPQEKIREALAATTY